MSRPVRAYLGLGSNLGDRAHYLQLAIDELASTNGVEVAGVSRVYATDPVGGPPQPEYLNAVVAVDTTLGARELLTVARRVEDAAQRVREERWGPRTLDVDILLVGDERVDDHDLVVPHPRMSHRAFVLAPLADLEPGLVVAPSAGWQGIRPTDVELRVTKSQK